VPHAIRPGVVEEITYIIECAGREQAQTSSAPEFQHAHASRREPLGLLGQSRPVLGTKLSFLRPIEQDPSLLPETRRLGMKSGDGLPIEPALMVHDNDHSVKPGQK
jgi:hypothetical protein